MTNFGGENLILFSLNGSLMRHRMHGKPFIFTQVFKYEIFLASVTYWVNCDILRSYSSQQGPCYLPLRMMWPFRGVTAYFAYRPQFLPRRFANRHLRLSSLIEIHYFPRTALYGQIWWDLLQPFWSKSLRIFWGG